jgi:predicted RNase H-like HicB family nuclease
MGEARVDARPAITEALKNEERCTISFMATYRVALRHSEEGYSVSCPGLPGCWSQGTTEEEALANIQVAIREYVEAAEELARDDESRVVEVAVA